jgi:hypothetical protein
MHLTERVAVLWLEPAARCGVGGPSVLVHFRGHLIPTACTIEEYLNRQKSELQLNGFLSGHSLPCRYKLLN